MDSKLTEIARVVRWGFCALVPIMLVAACGPGLPGECASDADCPDATVCEPSLGGGANVCAPGCHEDSQCGASEHCEQVVCITAPCPGHCVSSGCATDADCTSGRVCEPSGPSCGAPECVPGCHSDAQCASGQTCNIVQCFTCPCPGRCE